MNGLFSQYLSKVGSDRLASRWLARLDHTAAVGSRHHVVPRFLLSRFASSQSTLRVRDRSSGKDSIRSIYDLGIRDFYTSVTKDGKLDSALESLLSEVEGEMSSVLRRHVDARAFAHPRNFNTEERAVINTFVALQRTRGLRVRRTIELLTDYSVKMMNQGNLSGSGLNESLFLPHPNEHLEMLGRLADQVADVLQCRPAAIVRLDNPLLITGDEPVVSVSTPSQASGEHIGAADMEGATTLGSVGFSDSTAIMIAVSRSDVLIFGAEDAPDFSPSLVLRGRDAESFADEHNDLVIQAAVDWVAANPSDTRFASTAMPTPLPLVTVTGGDPQLAAQVNESTDRRPLRRLRSDDIGSQP